MWRFDSFHRHMLELKLVGAGIATLALGGVGVGMGTLFGSLLNAASRNPKQRDQLFSYAILGAALTEAIALFALMIAFLLLFLEFLESGSYRRGRNVHRRPLFFSPSIRRFEPWMVLMLS